MATQYTYVSPGVIKVTDDAGAATTLQFTATGQIQKIMDPLGRITNFTYDSNDYLSQVQAPGNTVYKFSYDAQGRLLSQTDPLNQTIRFTYGATGNTVLSVQDQQGQLMQYGYDAAGRLTQITYPDRRSETFTYDASGQLIEAKERSGDVFKYSYDTAGRLTRKTFDDNTFEAYVYDAKGNLASVTDVRGGITAMVYDTQNRLTKITYPTGRFLEYAYDSEGRRTQMKDQGGFTVNYAYDAQGQLSKLTNGSNEAIVTYAYDTTGRLAKETNGNGTYTTYSYDSAGQLLQIGNYKADGTANSVFEYTYDNLGRQTTAKTSDGTWSYTYDATGQLTGANFVSTNTQIPNQSLSYVYDAAGNRTRTVINGVTTNYASNNLNQYTTVGSATHAYDADGNLISIVDGTKSWTYTYNDENRLIRVVAPEGTWDYEYDPFGNRTASILNGQRTEYLVDPFGLGNVVGEYGSNGLIADYVHGLGLVGRFNGSNTGYYDSDFIGSTVGLTNTTGSYVNRYVYRPFGENLLTTESSANPFEYVGKWGVMDEIHSLDFMRARYYDSRVGRFTAKDPIGLEGRDTNFYRYVINQPVVGLDPQGTFAWFVPYLINAAAIYAFGGAVSGILTFAVKDFTRQTWTDVIKNTLSGPVGLIDVLETIPRPRGLHDLIPWPTPANRPVGLPELAPWPNLPQKSWWPSPSNRTPSNYAGNAAGSAARGLFDPLVLDLDGDGIELISIEDSTVQFDLNADGFIEQTGWVKSDDGMLVLDEGKDGSIKDIRELFGDGLIDGFVELKDLDSNNDNLINASDARFDDLQIWQDLNQNGISDRGELKTLAQLNISSISLTATPDSSFNQGNLIRNIGKYTLNNGTDRQAVSLFFAADRLNTQYNEPYQLKTETLFLPTVRGYGKLPDLYIAMSLDSQLLDLMREFVAIQPQNLDQVHTKVEQILFRWARVDGIDSTSRGQYFDARRLKFLETFLQQDFNFNFRSERQTFFIRQAWDIIIRSVSARLLAQGSLRALLPDTTYNLNTDTLTTTGNLDAVLNRLKAGVPADPANLPLYWSYAVSILDAHENNFNLTKLEYDNQIKAALAPSGLANNLDALRNPVFGSVNNDTFYGNGQPTFLMGREGNDTFFVSPGNDLIDGAAGDDTIPEVLGVDWVNGGVGTDVITRADFSNATNDITINNTNNPLIVLSTGARIIGVERFVVLTTGSGNDSITLTLIPDNNWIITGSGNDTVTTGAGQDHVEGGEGDDTLRGGAGNDGYAAFFSWGLDLSGLWGGAGNDVLFGDAGDDLLNGGAGNDTLNGGDGDDTFEPELGVDQILGGLGNDLMYLDFSSLTDKFTVTYTDAASGTVSNGSTFSSIEQVVITTSSGNDIINVTAAPKNNWIITGSGNDAVTTGVGQDRIEGGDGDDTLRGGAGNDGYLTFFPGGHKIAGLWGGAGHDALFGDAGDDLLNGGADNDTLNGGDGDDTFEVELGADQILGGLGNDLMYLNFSSLTDKFTVTYTDAASGTVSNGSTFSSIEQVVITTSSGNDIINVTAAPKNNWIITGAGNDTVTTGAGQDRIEGGDGDDILRGGAGDDSYATFFPGGRNIAGLWGGAGHDALFGEAGEDELVGGDGDDTLDGGAGNDFLEGNTGSDWFVFDTGTAFTITALGSDRFTDFTINIDKIVLGKTTFTVLTSPANGPLSASEFATINETANGTTVAGASSARIVFNRADGSLFYNPDGATVGLTGGGQFATLIGVTALSASDFRLRA